MEVLRITVVLQTLIFCKAIQNLTTSESTESKKHNQSMKETDLYITQTSSPCSWTVTSPGENQSLPIFTNDSVYPLALHVCESLGCGEVYKLNESTAAPNASCLSDCIYHHNTLINCSSTAGVDCRVVSEVICAAPHITPASKPCTWNLRSPEADSLIILTEEDVKRLPSEICQSLGCGTAFSQVIKRISSNRTCLTNCTYHNSHLRNCSTVVSSTCSVLSEVDCGNNKVSLKGGSHRCAGRVELWRAGQWGTVCDDQWDVRDADVVCAQLGCGYAISVTGQGHSYSQGSGPIYLDELNCTGKERSLWECPAVKNNTDCGHKEDAGVVCSEYKALRLTGGLDSCSGRVEIHRNGSWGTVCDDCWNTEEASMACNMLDCGSVKQFTGFKEPFAHNNATRWFYMCRSTATNLWNCKEIDTTAANRKHLCAQSIAAGLICSKSIGLPEPTSPEVTTPALTTLQMTTEGPEVLWSMELLGCIGLSAALLIAFIVNIILCCLAKKRRALTVQPQFSNLQTNAEVEENNYRDSVNLVKVTSNGTEPSAQMHPPQMWTQSSVESSSYDTDYEPNENATGPHFYPLSTFRNSMRYGVDGRGPSHNNTNLQSVTEEDFGVGGNAVMRGHQHQPYTTNGAIQGLNGAGSVDSFDTSSTSSGECYENTGLNAAELPVEQSREDSPIYSPVNTDINSYDSDYDDVACLQRPNQ